MAKRKRVFAVKDEGFGGLDVSSNPARMPGHSAQVAKNTNHRRPLLLGVRGGYARAVLAKFAYAPRKLHWFTSGDGVDRLLVHETGAGHLHGGDLPAPGWGNPPVVFGGAGPTFNPVTNLKLTNISTVTLTWTNPTSAFWRGTRIMRRVDAYPQGSNDPMAAKVYDGRNATCTDAGLAVGETGYYCAYAYSRTMWAKPDRTSVTRVSPTILALTIAALYRSTDGGVTWDTAIGLPTNDLQYVARVGSRVFVTHTGSGEDIYRSVDGGATFVKVGNLGGRNSHGRLIVANGGRLLVPHETSVSADWAVARSDDDGLTWTDSAVISSSNAHLDIAYGTGNNVVLTAQANSGNDPFTTHKSTNNGESFGAVVGGSDYSGHAYITVCANGNYLVRADDSGSGIKLLFSDDSGGTWSAKATLTTAALDALLAVAAAVFCSDGGTGDYQHSPDSGANFTKDTGDLGADATSVAYSNSIWFVGAGSDVYSGAALGSLTAVTSIATGTIISMAGFE